MKQVTLVTQMLHFHILESEIYEQYSIHQMILTIQLHYDKLNKGMTQFNANEDDG